MSDLDRLGIMQKRHEETVKICKVIKKHMHIKYCLSISAALKHDGVPTATQVGSQSISPLLVSIESGNMEAAKAGGRSIRHRCFS